MKGISYQNKQVKVLNTLFFLLGLTLPISLAINSIVIALFVIFSVFFFNLKKTLNFLCFKKIYIYYILYFLLLFLSLNYSHNKNIAAENVIKNLIFFIAPISFINLKHLLNLNNLRYFYFGLLLILVLSILKVYISIFDSILNSNFLLVDFFREGFVKKGIFKIHVPYLAMLTVFTFFYSIKIDYLKKNYLSRVIRILIFLLLISSLIFLSGLMSIFLLFFYFFIQFFHLKLSYPLKITIIFSTFIFLFLFYFAINEMGSIERIEGSETLFFRIQNLQLNDLNVRLQTWSSTIKVISHNFWFGIGADGGIDELLKYREPLTEPFVNMHNAHNNVLEIFLRYGFFGFLNYIVIIYFLVKNAIISKNYYFVWFLITFLVSGLTESYLQRQVGLVFFIFLSLFFYTLFDNRQDENLI